MYFRDINNYVYTYGRCLELFHITFIHYSLIRFYKGGDNAEYFRTAIYFAETVWCLKTMDYDSVWNNRFWWNWGIIEKRREKIGLRFDAYQTQHKKNVKLNGVLEKGKKGNDLDITYAIIIRSLD